jgi:uncharacterized protein YchJ
MEPVPTSGGRSQTSSATIVSREALFVGVWTREGFRRTSITPFKRGPFGGIKIGDSQEYDGKTMLYLEPIFAVWREQGFVKLPDGKARWQFWEPDPLDVCFCGGPQRFAECCKELVDQNANHQKRTESALDELNFAAAERHARAGLAQYVIWVRQHTVPTVNSSLGVYQELANIDVLALEWLVRQLGRAQRANQTDGAFVPQIRHLSRTIGIPQISARLIALASEWFFRAGRVEEGILELDSLGNFRKVSDPLALMTAAMFCDVDTPTREEMLRRASSSALCKEEKWTAQLALADRLFRRNAKVEALTLADAIITGACDPGESIGPLAEASLLRWRITKTAPDFEAAMSVLRRDPNRSRHAADLIDEGKYDEAEEFLAKEVKAGDLMAKVLLVDARMRSGKQDSARDLFLSIEGEIPPHMLCPYGVAAALVAVSLRDPKIRSLARTALSKLPAAALESDKSIQSYVTALDEGDWNMPTP